tara:strand:- start:1483 stop:5340 length:3858 start_codon:yes stop_codon:yes gene_type:complete
MKNSRSFFSDTVKGIFSSPSGKNILNLKHLDNNLDKIKKRIEEEAVKNGRAKNSKIWTQECGRIMGNFCEYVASLGFVLKVPHLTKKYGTEYTFGEWRPKNRIIKDIKDILSITGGGSRGGGIDMAISDIKKETLCCFSSKLKKMYEGKLNWADTEIEKMIGVKDKNNQSLRCYKNFIFGVFIFDKKHFKNKKKQYENIDIYDWEDLLIIWKQVYKELVKHSFDCGKINNFIGVAKEHMVPRFHQEKCSEASITYWKKGGKSFLYHHDSRSGKTISTLHTSTKIRSRLIDKDDNCPFNILLVTGFPSLNEMEWEDAIRKFYEFEDTNVVNFSAKRGAFDKNKDNFVMISLQDLKSRGEVVENLYGLDKKKFDAIRDVKWNLLVTDEVHYGVETKKTRNILKKISFKYHLALSATPYINYAYESFNESNTHRWTLLDEKEHSKTYEYYKKYPQLHFFIYKVPPEICENMLDEYDKEEGFTFRKILRLKPDGYFHYEQDVEVLINYIFGVKDKKNRYIVRDTPYQKIRNKGGREKGILIFVDECKQAKALKKLLLKNKKVTDIFGKQIDYTYSDKNKASELKDWLKVHAVPPFIIIAVDQLTTGVTIKDVDTVILLNDGEAAQPLIQKMMRCRTPAEGKTDAYILDMNPARSINILYEQVLVESSNKKMDPLKLFEKYWYDLYDVTYHDGELVNNTKEIENLFLEASYNYNNNFGRRNFITNLTLGFINYVSDIKIKIEKNKKNKKAADHGIIKGKNYNRDGDNNKNKAGEVESEEKRREREALEKFENILNNISWASVLCRCKYNDYNGIFKYLDKNPQIKALYDELIYEDIADVNSVMTGEQISNFIKECADVNRINAYIISINNTVKMKPEKTNEILGLTHSVDNRIKKMFGEIFTPPLLIEDILSKLPPEAWLDKNKKWIDPACGTGGFLLAIKNRLMESLKHQIKNEEERKKHILENMIYGTDIQERNTALCELLLDPSGRYKLNIETQDSLDFNFWKLKFDFVISNPPYQKKRESSDKKTQPLWPEFVNKFIFICKKDGYIGAIHPGGWRANSNTYRDVGKTITSKQVEYLEIHNEKDGLKVFKSDTRYDWYIIKNTPYKKTTIVKDEKGIVSNIDLKHTLKDIKTIPNFNISGIKKVLAKKDEKKVTLMADSSYHTQKEYMSKEKTGEFKYPCSYTVNSKGKLSLWYSRNDTKGHFGIPKIIFSNGRVTSANYFIDEEGKYGLTQFSYGIIDNVDNFENIYKAMRTKEFKDIMESVATAQQKIEVSIFKLFRKDFWKEFV